MSKRIRNLFGFALGTTAAWAFAVKPRIWDKPDLGDIRRYDYAGRGLYDPDKGIPENSIAAFRAALDHGYGVTMDVRVTADGVPVVFRDERLYRMTGAEGSVEDRMLEELHELKLAGTEEEIPTLEEALAVIAGQVPVLIELKVFDENVEYLCAEVCDVLDTYEGVFAIQTTDPRVLRWYRQERNEYIRGQIVDYQMSSGYTWKNRVWDLFCNSLFMNFLTEPDFISCSLTTRYNPSVWLCRLLYRIPRFLWTAMTMEDYEDIKMDGAIAVFERIDP